MVKIVIGENEGNQRLDKFLRKYLQKAPLSMIYKLIRKDVKVNGSRAKESRMLEPGDLLTIYMDETEIDRLSKREQRPRAGKSFEIAFENDDLLVAVKPAGLLTHGDSREKRNHLANQVVDYLLDSGSYDPAAERSFTPAPCNRLDRNTSGLVVFGKNSRATRAMNKAIKDGDRVIKEYLAIAKGEANSILTLEDVMVKDEDRNKARIVGAEAEAAAKPKIMRTVAEPIATVHGMTLFKVHIDTGRTHQIRVQLASAGHPIAGDPKYGDPKLNRELREKYGVEHQLLSATRLEFRDMPDALSYLNGTEVQCDPPETFLAVKNACFNR